MCTLLVCTKTVNNFYTLIFSIFSSLFIHLSLISTSSFTYIHTLITSSFFSHMHVHITYAFLSSTQYLSLKCFILAPIISTHVANSADFIIFRHKSHFNKFYASFCKPEFCFHHHSNMG